MTAPRVQPFRGSYLLPSPERATVSDVMHRGVIACPPDTPLREIAAIMATHGVHCVVIDGVATDAVHGEQLVWGLLTDLDLARALAAGTADESAGRHAGGEVVAVAPGDALIAAARRMAEHDCTHLVVVSETTRRPVGVLSTLDVARALAWGGD